MAWHKLIVAWMVASLSGWMWESSTIYGFEDRPTCTLRPEGSEQEQFPPVITALAFHRQGRFLAAAGDDHAVRVWDTVARRSMATLRVHTDWVHGVCVPDADDVVASVAADGRLIEWNWRTDRHRTLLSTSRPLWAVASTPDGQQLVTAGFDAPIYVVDRPTGRVAFRIDGACRDIRALAVSPDGALIAAGGRDGKLYIISTEFGKVLRTIPAHGRSIRAVAFDATGTRVVSGGDDRSLCLWDVGDGNELMHLQSGTAKMQGMCLLGAHRVATAGSDNLIRIWDLRLRTETARIEGHGGSIAALAAQGTQLASGGYDAAIRLWELPDDIRWQTAKQQETTER